MQNLHSFTHALILVLVLQGNAATKLRCGGKFFILLISYFLLILTVKEFLKSTNICQSYSKNKSGPVFSDSQCILMVLQKTWIDFRRAILLRDNRNHSVQLWCCMLWLCHIHKPNNINIWAQNTKKQGSYRSSAVKFPEFSQTFQVMEWQFPWPYQNNYPITQMLLMVHCTL